MRDRPSREAAPHLGPYYGETDCGVGTNDLKGSFGGSCNLGQVTSPLKFPLPHLQKGHLSLGVSQGVLTGYKFSKSLILQAKSCKKEGEGVWKGAAEVISDGNANL